RELWSHPLRVSHYVTAMALSPNGQTFCFAAGRELRVYDFKSKEGLACLTASAKHFQAAAFSQDGRCLTTVSNDETAVIWDTRDTQTWSQRKAYAWRIGKLKCVALSPDGCLAAAGSDKGKIVMWDVE